MIGRNAAPVNRRSGAVENHFVHVGVSNILQVTMCCIDHRTRENWIPLEIQLPPLECVQFMWMYQLDGLEHYKHIETRRYLRLDAEGKCYAPADAGWEEVPFEDQWKRVTGRT